MKKIPNPIKKKNSTMKKNLFLAVPESGPRRVSIYRFSDWSPVAAELGTDPHLGLARTAN
jgi:hypothetical protein